MITIASLPQGKQKFEFGCYYKMDPMRNGNINLSIDIKWYAWPFLLWKQARKTLELKWYQYPFLIKFIVEESFRQVIKKRSV